MDVLKKIEWLKREVEELEAQVLENKNVPGKGEKYWQLTEAGNVDWDNWDNEEFDYDVWNNGNGFFSKEDAEFERERRKVIKELKEFARPFIKDQYNHYICYQHDFNEIRVEGAICFQDNNLYFSSVEKTWEAIKVVGIDRIKKYYLQVPEV